MKVESKVLVQACKKAGLKGKGSALASLSDDEVEQVTQLLRESKPKPSPKTAPEVDPNAAPVRRPSASTPSGRVPVLKPSTPKKRPVEKKPPKKEEVPETPSKEETPPIKPTVTPTEGEEKPPEKKEPAEAPAAKKTETEGAPEKQAKSKPPGKPKIEVTPTAPTGSIQRDDYVGKKGQQEKVPVLRGRKSPPREEEREESRPSGGGKQGPSVRLAPMPSAKPTKKEKAKKEPAPQKPDIKLPLDAIRAAAKGAARPLDEHIRQHEQKQKKKKEGGEVTKPGRGRGGKPMQPSDLLEEKEKATKKRSRKGKMPRDENQLVGRGRKKHSGGRRFRQESGTEDFSGPPRQLRRLRRTGTTNSAAPRKSNIVIQLPCTVKQFAEMTGVSVANVQKKLLEMGLVLNINASLDYEAAELLASELDLKAEVRPEQSLEQRVVTSIEELEDAPEDLKPRPPIVTFLGHVDHGKTSLLDRIIGQDVVSGEKGGITQHIRAYRVSGESGDVTFVDTPGHEAFTEMRARGANCTDLAVLVVAADDGVMPQTEEAISHAKAAEVPIVVAMNKIDLPGANPDKTLQELAANEILSSEWGGDVEIVRTSAVSGEGMEELMETLLTVAELHELRSNPDRPAMGLALESEVQTGQGVVCKAIVRHGTLRTGDVILCGQAYGRVRVMYDTLNPDQRVDEAPPSTPVNLIGLNEAPEAGEQFLVLDDLSKARQIAEERAEEARQRDVSAAAPHVTLESLYQRLGQGGEPQTLNVIIRADVRGSIEAIRKELGKLDHPEVKIKILQATVGGITEADVHLADASDAIIVGFSVVPEEGARTLAEKKGVQIRRYDIIYKLTDELKAAMEGMLKPEQREKELGRALVQKTFSISRVGTVAGCRVLAGHIERDSRVRVIRDSRIIGDYPLDTLKREKDDAREVREGYECGMKLKGYNDIKEGDVLESYKIEEIARSL